MASDGGMVSGQTLSGLLVPPAPEGSVAVRVSVGTRLHELSVGDRAIVKGPTSYDATVIRLLEMGLTPGVEVTLSRRAPASDPIEIEVRGTRLCLRRADAARFAVTPIGSR